MAGTRPAGGAFEVMETILNIFGGVALLLWGIRMVRTGVSRSFGAELRQVLTVSARNRVTAFGAGLAITAAIQSSTATAMIVSSFAGQALISGIAAYAIMLGADVGTAVVVQVLSFDLQWLSPVLILVGVILFMGADKSRRKNTGRIMIGLGLVLLSLRLIVLASAPLRASETVSVLLQPLASEPIMAIVLVAALTWASHSSVAIVLLIISMGSMQVLSLQMAIVMVLGANLGGGLPAVGLTMKAPPASRRVPLGNLAMRAIGVIVVMPFVPYLVPYLSLFGDTPGPVIATAHLAFNVFLAALFLPLLGIVAGLGRRFVPDLEVADDTMEPRYLDRAALDTPAVALNCAARETLRMGDEVRHMLNATEEVFRTNDGDAKQRIENTDDLVDRLHEAIKMYLTHLSTEEFDALESERCVEILSFTTNLEHIGDIIDKNLMELAGKKIKARTAFSPEGQREIRDFHEHILANLDLAMSVFMSSDLELARRLLREKTVIRDLERRYVQNHFQRIGEGRADSIQTSSLHLDVLRDLKRINSHLTSVVYPILERAGELADSRLIDDAVDEHERSELPAPGSTDRPQEA